ncbi:MAG: hypothetical protein JO317_05850 [Verrucomicrobiae bacterium]|nr:hypothetical protein [Verrucomicrobiae bacterium]
MNDDRLKKLFQAAAQSPSPSPKPPAGFDGRVLARVAMEREESFSMEADFVRAAKRFVWPAMAAATLMLAVEVWVADRPEPLEQQNGELASVWLGETL